MKEAKTQRGHYRATEDGASMTRKGAKSDGIKTAVTTTPSKLDSDGKATSLKRWNCYSYKYLYGQATANPF